MPAADSSTAPAGELAAPAADGAELAVVQAAPEAADTSMATSAAAAEPTAAARRPPQTLLEPMAKQRRLSMEVGAIEHVDELPNPWSECSVPQVLDDVDEGFDGWGFDGNYDDSPLTLTDEQVQVGKLRELSQMESFKIYRTATRKEASDCKHITTRWEVQMRHDKDKRPFARCRFVAREFRRGDPRDDIFAPASSAITSRIVALKAQKRRGYIRFTLDASNAFFHAPCLEKCSVDPPAEWLEQWVKKGGNPDVVWILERELYGRRVAPCRWTTWFAQQLVGIGMQQCPEAPWVFQHGSRDLTLEVHMDDGHGCGDPEDVEWFIRALSDTVQLKESVLHKNGDTYEHLKRIFEVGVDETKVRANPRYAEKMGKILGLTTCTPVSSPMVDSFPEEIEAAIPLVGALVTTYRAAVGLALYIAPDRPDMQNAARHISRYMSAPTDLNMIQVKRLCRYLLGTKGYYIRIPTIGDCSVLKAYSDSNHAGCLQTRRSTSCGAFVLGGAALFGFSRTQKPLALSSAESEWYGAADTASEGIFLCSVLNFVGIRCSLEVFMDSSAALAMTKRIGVGRVRHVDSRTLWLQTGSERGLFVTTKIDGQHNLADLGTKNHSGPRLRSLLEMLGMGGVTIRGVAREVQSVERLTRDDFKKLLWLATLMESAVRASGVDTDGQWNLAAGAQTPLNNDWSFEVFVLLMIFSWILIGCACGGLAAVLWRSTPCRSGRAALLTWLAPCAHLQTTSTGTNQWQLRRTCVTCGVVVLTEDTPKNLERKARQETSSSATVLPPTSAEPLAPAADEAIQAKKQQ